MIKVGYAVDGIDWGLSVASLRSFVLLFRSKVVRVGCCVLALAGGCFGQRTLATPTGIEPVFPP